jgi:nitroreductase
MELTEAVQRRHMTRSFSDRPLEPGVLDRLLALALRAPSAGHTQGREFVVLEGSEQTAPFWEATTDEAWRARSRRYEGLSRAPVVVLAFADSEAYVARYREPDKLPPEGSDVGWVVPFWFVDAGFAVMTLLLGAADAGLGSAFLGNFRGEEALRAALGVPERLGWLGAVLLGGVGAGPPAGLRSPPATHPRGQRSPGRLVAGTGGTWSSERSHRRSTRSSFMNALIVDLRTQRAYNLYHQDETHRCGAGPLSEPGAGP